MTTLEEKDGYLYVVHSDTDYDAPVLRRLWYPIGVKADGFHHHIGTRLKSLGDGLYQPYYGASPIKYRLVDRGRTLPAFSEEEPVPPPKTSVETRWRAGRWEKYLKRAVWVVA